jgi:integrase/recombinase XerD
MNIKEIIPVYITHLHALGRSPFTIKKTRSGLKDLICFLEQEGITQVQDLTREGLEEYQQDLAFRLTAKGTLLNLRTQETRLCTAKGFTRFLKEKDYLVSDPGKHIQLPKQPKRLPQVNLSQSEVKKLMQAPNMQTRLGYRNRVILEILYDTGIRRMEASNLKVTDLDLNTGYVHIRGGKGDKDRVVPLSQKVCGLTQNYILAIRPSIVQGKDHGYLFINQYGEPIHPNGIWRVVKRCVRLAQIKKNISTHTLRHTCATHMLRNGAPIRHIQEMLGHESLESTQVYTKVTINDLKEIHAKYHPSKTLTP